MPSGFIAIVAWLTAFILWWSGWRKEMAGNLPEKLLTWLLLLWPLAFRLNVALPVGSRELACNGALAWALAVALLALVRLEAARRGTIGAAALLIGALVLFADGMIEHAPGFMQFDTVWFTPLLAAMAVFVMMRGAAEQLATLTIGLALAEAARALGTALGGGQAELGGGMWADRWWLAAGGVRLAACLAALAAGWVRRLEKSRKWS